jgi:hypothetical protein
VQRMHLGLGHAERCRHVHARSCGTAVGHEPAAIAVPDTANVRTVAATQTASATEEYTRENFTAVTLQPLVTPFNWQPCS